MPLKKLQTDSVFLGKASRREHKATGASFLLHQGSGFSVGTVHPDKELDHCAAPGTGNLYQFGSVFSLLTSVQ